MNQNFGSPLVKTRMMDEFKKRAMVNFIATETFSFVRVSCFSSIENLLMMKIIPKFVAATENEHNIEMNLERLWSE